MCFFASTDCCPSEEAKACTQLKCLIAWIVEKALHISGCLSDKVKLCSDGGQSKQHACEQGEVAAVWHPALLAMLRGKQSAGNPEDNRKQQQEVRKCLLQWKDGIICFL